MNVTVICEMTVTFICYGFLKPSHTSSAGLGERSGFRNPINAKLDKPSASLGSRPCFAISAAYESMLKSVRIVLTQNARRGPSWSWTALRKITWSSGEPCAKPTGWEENPLSAMASGLSVRERSGV